MSGGIHDHHVEIEGNLEAVVQVEFLDGSVHHKTPFDHAGRVTEPGGIPERGNLARCLISCSGAAIEIFKGGGIEK